VSCDAVPEEVLLMTHAHDHRHDPSTYYLEQLFTIAVCGALGVVAVLLWYTDKARLILHPKFHSWLLVGGLTLLTLVGVLYLLHMPDQGFRVPPDVPLNPVAPPPEVPATGVDFNVGFV
jgi:hypothetical protein